MKHVVLTPVDTPRGKKRASAPARKLAESLADALSSVGKVYYGVEERGSSGWELAVSVGGLHYVFVLSYVLETRSFLVIYGSSVLSALLFWWRGFSAGPRIEKSLRGWAESHPDIDSCKFFTAGGLAEYEREQMKENA